MTDFMIRTRRFKNNPLLGRKQFVVEVLHPNVGTVSKVDMTKKIAHTYKVHDSQCIQLFGFKTAFGGGRTTGFGLIYENLDKVFIWKRPKVRKFEPQYRLKRAGLGGVKKGPGRRAKKDTKNRAKKVRGKEKTKVKKGAGKK